MRRLLLALLAGLLALGAALPALAQDDTGEDVEDSTATTAAVVQPDSEIEILDVNTSRYDDQGTTLMVIELRNFQSIDPNQLQVFEDGEPVDNLEVALLSESSTEVGIVLAIDTSGSMNGEPIEAAKAAALSFVSQKRAQDAIALVIFDDEVQVLSGFTKDGAALAARIESIEADGETAFFDAVITSSNLFANVSEDNQDRNLIILTDGADTVAEDKEAAKADALAAAAANGVRVFGVALEGTDFNPTDLEEIVAANDGLYRATPELSELEALYGEIQRELNNKLAVRFNARQSNNEQVEFSVSYGSLDDSQTEGVPGYVVFVPRDREVTTTTRIELEPPLALPVVESSGFASAASLRLMAVLGVGVALALFVIIVIRLNPDADEDLVGARLRAYGRRGAVGSEEAGGFLSRIPLLRRFTERAEEVAKNRGLLGALNSALEQGNIPLRAGEAIAAGVGLSAIAGVLTALFTQNLAFGIGGFILALLIVMAAIQIAGEREKRRFENQLPDTLTLISTSLRAGYSLLQAVEAVAAEAPAPTSREFGRAIAESRLGRPVVQSLEGISERMRSEDFEWAVMAIEIQREVGGNLAEVLQIVAETMLQRNRLRREVSALTAEGRISALVLGLMPIALFGFLFLTNRDYLSPLISSTAGLIGLGIGIGLMIVGGVWLRRITTIEV
jgi:tight adherence protein B